MGGTLTHPLQRPVKSEKHLLVKGLKSLSTLSSTDMPGGLLMQSSKVQNGFIMSKVAFKDTSLTYFFFYLFIFLNKESEITAVLLIWVRVVIGNMINNYINSKFASSFYLKVSAAPPPALSLY